MWRLVVRKAAGPNEEHVKKSTHTHTNPHPDPDPHPHPHPHLHPHPHTRTGSVGRRVIATKIEFLEFGIS